MTHTPTVLNPLRCRQVKGYLKASRIEVQSVPVMIPPPGQKQEFGKLTLKKEGGAVKGFEYQCVCGHKDYFVCE